MRITNLIMLKSFCHKIMLEKKSFIICNLVTLYQPSCKVEKAKNTLGKYLSQVMAICSFSLLSCVLSPPILRRPTRGEILCLNISTKVKKIRIYNQAATGLIFNCLIVLLFPPDLAVAGLYFGTFIL